MDKHLLLVHAHPDDESIGQGATMARYVAEGHRRHAGHLHRRRDGRDPGARARAPGRRQGRHPRRPAQDRARQRDEGARRHRPPLPRRLQALPRLRHAVARGRPRGRRPTTSTRTPSGTPTSPRPRATSSRSSARCGRRCWSPTTSSAATATPTTSRPTGSRRTPPRWPPCRPTGRDLGRGRTTSPRSTGARCRRARMRQGLRDLREAGDTTTFEGMDPDDAAAVHGRRRGPRRDGRGRRLRRRQDGRRMRAHATQIAVDGPFFALSNNMGNEIWGTEFFRIAKGTPGPGRRPTVWRPTCSPDSADPARVTDKLGAQGRRVHRPGPGRCWWPSPGPRSTSGQATRRPAARRRGRRHRRAVRRHRPSRELRSTLAERTAEPIVVSYGDGRSRSIDPAQAGPRSTTQASVEEAVAARELGPRRMWAADHRRR